MQELMTELGRLYLLQDQLFQEQQPEGHGYAPAGALTPSRLEQHLRGESTLAIDLVASDGLCRALTITFNGAAAGKGERNWRALCDVANGLQQDLSLPAAAVSINGADGYGLWLSLQSPIPAEQAQHFLQLLKKAYFPDFKEADVALLPATGKTLAELPPCLHRATGKWAAFIHPGMGAAFAEEPGLEMAPPLAAQAAFLDGLKSISAAQFTQALQQLQQQHGAAMPASPRATTQGLLLQDATLEDIVAFLHTKNIEPTFRHLLPK